MMYVSGTSASRPRHLLVATATALATVAVGATPAAADTVQPGTVAGQGFDACTAPSSATMQAWLSSPYRTIGIYFGGNNRGCTQPNLTAAWVDQQQAAGWHLMPLYVGPQASCTTSSKPNLINDAQAAAQGRATAEDAVVQARALGLARESILIYDMEAYRTGPAYATCRAGVLAFISAWTARLHDHGYFSGFYSSMASGVRDQVASYNTPGYVRPDYLDFARWDGIATVTDPEIPAGYWWPHRRIKQYQGDHVETHGGVSINIDNDYLDVAPLPGAQFADFTGNGWSDVLARTASTGNLYLYPGNGTVVDNGARSWMGGGWGALDAIVRLGDLNADGREDLVARETSTGDLWFYPGTGTGVGTRKRVGVGWNGMREITPIGDLTGDGLPDLVAIQRSTNLLFLYPGRSTVAFGTRVTVGSGWTSYAELTGVGDFDRDGRPDLMARRNTDGTLQFWPGRASGFGTRRQVGVGWNGMRDLVGVGDFDRNGYPDLAAVRSSDGVLFRYPGNGVGLGTRVQLATGFDGRRPVL
jgi:hypothetical protein